MPKQYTIYDVTEVLLDRCKDDSMRFKYFASCILAGASQPENLIPINDIDDKKKLILIDQLFEKMAPSFYDLRRKEQSETIRSKILDSLDNEKDININEFEKNVRELFERIRGDKIKSKKGILDLFRLSMQLGNLFFLRAEKQQYFDVALNEIGQLSEQRIRNGYRNRNFGFCIDPNTRNHENARTCYIHEYNVIAQSLDQMLNKYIG